MEGVSFKDNNEKQYIMNIVKQIHNEIDTAQLRLLNQAREIIKKSENSDNDIILKAERLEKLGFKNTPASVIANKQKKKQIEVVKTKEQAELIEYYIREYPFQKSIRRLSASMIPL